MMSSLVRRRRHRSRHGIAVLAMLLILGLLSISALVKQQQLYGLITIITHHTTTLSRETKTTTIVHRSNNAQPIDIQGSSLTNSHEILSPTSRPARNAANKTPESNQIQSNQIQSTNSTLNQTNPFNATKYTLADEVSLSTTATQPPKNNPTDDVFHHQTTSHLPAVTNIILPTENTIVSSPNTVVTAFFPLPGAAKHPVRMYDRSMGNMLSQLDAMVIFTTPERVSTMQRHRSHASNQTVIVTMPLESLPLARHYNNTSFWQAQFDMDPQRASHKSYRLYWIWLSKSWFVTEAIRLNVFHSDVFVWSDIGCYRNDKYNGKRLVTHRELVPRHAMLQMAHHPPRPPRDLWWNDKIRQPKHFFHSGTQQIGYADTWRVFHSEFLKTIEGFVERDMMFVGEDQTVLQCTCLRNPNLCAYVRSETVDDDSYFGLRYVLVYGGNHTVWRPPGATPTKQCRWEHCSLQKFAQDSTNNN